ncbi:hypothetical protein GCM10028817_00780 [Spirosoma pomorum]
MRGEDNYATVISVTARINLRLAQFATHLPELVRIYKSDLVNPDYVVECSHKRTTEARVLIGKQWLPIRRRQVTVVCVKLMAKTGEYSC